MAKMNKAPGCSTARWHKARLILTGALIGALITGRLQTASTFASQRLTVSGVSAFARSPPGLGASGGLENNINSQSQGFTTVLRTRTVAY